MQYISNDVIIGVHWDDKKSRGQISALFVATFFAVHYLLLLKNVSYNFIATIPRNTSKILFPMTLRIIGIHLLS